MATTDLLWVPKAVQITGGELLLLLKSLDMILNRCDVVLAFTASSNGTRSAVCIGETA